MAPRTHVLRSSLHARYAIRFLILLLTMETPIHACFWSLFFVWLKVRCIIQSISPVVIVYCKTLNRFYPTFFAWVCEASFREQLLLPWQFYCLWALMDGLDPPKNMVRSMSNNCLPLGFWRSWHRSFNILMMMGANLVGFVVGMDGAHLPDVLSCPSRTRAGIRFLLVACVCLFVGVQLMFEYRCVRSFM
jgi:hypothetical protein